LEKVAVRKEISPSLRPRQEVAATEFESSFGSFLVEEKIVDRSILERAIGAGQKTGERLDRVMIKLGFVSEMELTTALGAYLGVPLAVPEDFPIAPVLLNVAEAGFVLRNRVLPLSDSNQSILLGVVDPLDTDPVRALEYLTELRAETKLIAPSDFERIYTALYSEETGRNEGRHGHDPDAHEVDVQRLRDLASEAPIIRLVNQIVAEAVDIGASDIHVEAGENEVLVRYRIDGVLRTAQALALSLRPAITSRIKVMSKLDIAERRLPQDGRVKIAVRGTEIDFRVSTMPTIFGESVVLRILDRSRIKLNFEALGFPKEHIADFGALLSEPNGIILVTGPTGSGKTTTLYTMLRALNGTDRKIFTVEDPIEYQLAGINQVQVQANIGFDFPQALRSILRQDPDIIMVGEIRDTETARIAIQASLTGHLVLSTLHTNNASAAITRLLDMGLEPYLLASTIKGVIAQRLVRTLCRYCSVQHSAADHWARELSGRMPSLSSHPVANIRSAVGCQACGNTGYIGRSTVAEILFVDGETQRLVMAGVPDREIEAQARDRGMVDMYHAGVRKIWCGETTVEEVMRVTRVG
jgi:general secretion pathway protein E